MSVCEELPEQPRRTIAFCAAIVPLDLSWFTLRLTVDDQSILIDNDITMGGGALFDLKRLASSAGNDGDGAVEFDNESMDTSYLAISKFAPGLSRVIVGDWCHEGEPLRLDVIAPTELVRSALTTAITEFEAIDVIAPLWSKRFSD